MVDDILAVKAARNYRILRSHGSTVRYRHDSIGVNSRLDTLQAAALSVKLRYRGTAPTPLADAETALITGGVVSAEPRISQE